MLKKLKFFKLFVCLVFLWVNCIENGLAFTSSLNSSSYNLIILNSLIYKVFNNTSLIIAPKKESVFVETSILIIKNFNTSKNNVCSNIKDIIDTQKQIVFNMNKVLMNFISNSGSKETSIHSKDHKNFNFQSAGIFSYINRFIENLFIINDKKILIKNFKKDIKITLFCFKMKNLINNIYENIYCKTKIIKRDGLFSLKNKIYSFCKVFEREKRNKSINIVDRQTIQETNNQDSYHGFKINLKYKNYKKCIDIKNVYTLFLFCEYRLFGGSL